MFFPSELIAIGLVVVAVLTASFAYHRREQPLPHGKTRWTTGLRVETIGVGAALVSILVIAATALHAPFLFVMGLGLLLSSLWVATALSLLPRSFVFGAIFGAVISAAAALALR